MKRLILFVFLILISVSVFAEDFIVGEEKPAQKPSDVVEMAQLQAQLINLNNKLDKLERESIKAQDINLMRDDFFKEAEGFINYFLAQVLLMLGGVIVFLFASLFVLKAKKWL